MRLNRFSTVAMLVAVFWLALSAPSAMAQMIQLDPPPGDPATPREEQEAPPRADLPDTPPARGRSESPSARLTGEGEARTELVPLRPAALRSHDAGASRLTGEMASEQFILFLPQAPGATGLQLAHRTGIDALPERSALTVVVNGTELGQIMPSNFGGFAAETLDVPDGVLQAGRNLVEVRARHTHRVACGVDASFALWTEIDARNSGVVMAADAFTPSPIGFMAAVAAQAARGLPVTFRRSDPGASMLDAVPFIAQAVIAIGGTPPEIESAPYWTMADDIPSMARITILPADEGAAEPEFLRGGDGALVLVLNEAQDYDAVLGALLSAIGVAPDSAASTLTPGVAQRLSDLGARRLVGQGHYIVKSVDFALPWDWVLLASQKARLDLDYRFAAGLPEGALLLVKVNGTTVRMLPLDREGGQTLPTLPVSFGARLLQAGVNRLEFEALIPGDPPDVACAPMDGPVLEVSEGSRLFVPASPRMSLPSIDMALGMIAPDEIFLTPSAQAQVPPGLVPQIAAALMVSQGQRRPAGPGQRFNIGTLSDVEQLQALGMRLPIRAFYDVLGSEGVRSGPVEPTANPWETVGNGGTAGISSWLRLDAIAALPGRIVDTIVGLAYGTTPPMSVWLAGRQAEAALLQPDPDQPGEIWMIFAPHADPLTVVRALGASRTGRDRPQGQLALYSEARGWDSWTSPDRSLTLHERVGPGNLRAVMGNYATLSPVPFLGVVLLLTLLSAVVALAILILTRRRG